MSKRISRAQRARNLINKGYSNKYIFEHFPYIPKQTVYSERWKINKQKGLASLPKPEAVATGTGITSSAPRAVVPLEFEIIDRPNDKRTVKASNNRRNAQLARHARERQEREMRENAAINKLLLQHHARQVASPKPTLWQKIKGLLVALYAGK